MYSEPPQTFPPLPRHVASLLIVFMQEEKIWSVTREKRQDGEAEQQLWGAEAGGEFPGGPLPRLPSRFPAPIPAAGGAGGRPRVRGGGWGAPGRRRRRPRGATAAQSGAGVAERRSSPSSLAVLGRRRDGRGRRGSSAPQHLFPAPEVCEGAPRAAEGPPAGLGGAGSPGGKAGDLPPSA